MAKGEFAGIDSTVVSAKYDSMLESPVTLTFWTILVILLAFWICSIGLQKGVEKIMKITMLCLLAIMVVLAIGQLLFRVQQKDSDFTSFRISEKYSKTGSETLFSEQ